LAVPAAQWIIYGMLMVLIVFLLPRGIVPAVGELIGRRGGGEGSAPLLAQELPEASEPR
jgi:branched-chain amino acid transport system permease protein